MSGRGGVPDTIKIIVVGNAETGKTAIIKRVVKGQFSDEYEGTIGVDFLTKQMNTHGEDMELQIWGLAQQTQTWQHCN